MSLFFFYEGYEWWNFLDVVFEVVGNLGNMKGFVRLSYNLNLIIWVIF